MIIKVYFEKTEKTIPFNNQHQMNGFIFTMLGEKASKYHESFSNYSISSIQGGRMNEDKSGLIFNGEPYIQITSDDISVCNDFVCAIINSIDNKSANFFGLHPTRFETFDFPCGKKFDIIRTISPILLKNDGRKLTVSDEGWIELLNKKCKEKLQHQGIEDNSFKIVIGNNANIKRRMVYVGEVFNPCTDGVFTVYGKEETRKKLYNMGIGNSTGTGFGAVKMIIKEKEF